MCWTETTRRFFSCGATTGAVIGSGQHEAEEPIVPIQSTTKTYRCKNYTKYSTHFYQYVQTYRLSHHGQEPPEQSVYEYHDRFRIFQVPPCNDITMYRAQWETTRECKTGYNGIGECRVKRANQNMRVGHIYPGAPTSGTQALTTQQQAQFRQAMWPHGPGYT
ncbi:hypothetical protein K435DRAFT_778692 [Dendrothele bispora CBS 962.96]|uniref:Uncharacterized protein n=1 Tax=Dendrothele bispora (strain CBS 962.96) TaxID=1314807 RepID=A0A4S8M252_DENBC|nr:hypothetical protein K435DRAFT_784469 [Dendrothele bispora CBS 962.96]THU96166.1 hypothetical protein K435DRAFT_778692 [Dendrothele bispora CBS 962.96]